MESNLGTTRAWTATGKRIATMAILCYLFVLVMGPLTIPSGAPHLTVPLAEKIAPLHQALFLGHGYRFFGPDPGDSHSVGYRIRTADGTTVEGHFPDRDATFPRLLYHRWFMLSETLFREGNTVPAQEDLDAIKKQYTEGIQRFQNEGRRRITQQLIREQKAELDGIESARKRRDILIRSIAKVLLNRHDGQSITMTILTRRLPTPEEVQDGIKLDDPVFLNAFEIGTYGREEVFSDQSLPVNGERQTELPQLESMPTTKSSTLGQDEGRR